MNTYLKNYSVPDNKAWSGRVDNPNDPESFRMHQIIQLLDLTKIKSDKFDLSKLNICILGFCCDEGVRRNLGRQGAANGPEYIRKEFANLPVTFGENAIIYDAGDINCFENNMEQAQEQLEIAVKIILDNKLFPFVLGGGHELALGHFNGIVSHLGDKQSVGIINFDAHLDLRPYKSQGSSGTMFSQIADNCLSKDRSFNYMCLGVQTYGNTISLFKRADSLGVKYILAKDLIESNYQRNLEEINYFIEKQECLYITICSDVFNSAYAPGVSSIQPFGLNPEIVLDFLKQIFKSQKVISLDIAEISPRFDSDNRSAKLVAVILYAIINILNESKV